MTHGPERHARALPSPDLVAPGLTTTYDAKDPDTAFPGSNR